MSTYNIMQAKPLVSIICLCYNHENFVEEALQSLMEQTYESIEVIVVDDGSTDKSLDRIRRYCKKYPEVKIITHSHNVGICKSFNEALQLAKGVYIVNHAADDVLSSNKIKLAVEAFLQLPVDYGVHFTDVAYINESGETLGKHSSDYKRQYSEDVPSGDVFELVLRHFFIADPSMVVKREVLDELEGYDERLSYEDFDFWVRSSRKWKYCYSNQVLVKKRRVPGSVSSVQKAVFNPHMSSTLVVIEKAAALIKTDHEAKALIKRIHYELKWAVFTGNWSSALRMLRIRHKIKKAYR